MNAIGATVASGVSTAIQQLGKPPRRDDDDVKQAGQSHPPPRGPDDAGEARSGRTLDIQA
ncbi:MAG: hypothetical protein AB7O80_11870 [Acetobacteraceae bacterium]